ncbi:MAG: 4-hydroxy-tetrahydrodipicolinate synthase [Gammaproteobacteria bacterium]|nr:4-hydroxy-tetrahydrodipicolinate synthase [Gammaproteobacteria bacterium]
MIKGSIVAIVTPMHLDGEIDFPAFDRLLEWHIDSGTDAIVVVGTTGESATLSIQEHCDLVAHCVNTVSGRIPVVAGTGSNSTQEALFFTESAKSNGADACLLVTPYYNKPSQEGLYQHFKTIAESVDIPQILYNVPGRTACDLLPETVERLAGLPAITGLKEATGSIERAQHVIARCGDSLAVYGGDDPIAMELMLNGAKGNISVTANVAPSIMHELCEASMAGNRQQATVLNDKVALLHERLFLESNPVPVKWALYRMGLIGPGIRLPLVELNADFHDQVCEALKAAGVELEN